MLGALRCTLVTGGEGGGGEDRDRGDEWPTLGALREEDNVGADAISGAGEEDVEVWAVAGDAAGDEDDEHRPVVGVVVDVAEEMDAELGDETAGEPASQTNDPEKKRPTVSPSSWLSSAAAGSAATGATLVVGPGSLPPSQS